MQKKRKSPYRIQFLYRPGDSMTNTELRGLAHRIHDTAATCFERVPAYQAMTGTRGEMSDKVLALAIRPDNVIAGFCSTVLLPVEGVGDVLHLGLTCVRPEDRRFGLTHLLTKKVVVGYLLRFRPVRKQWISNCAAVLSSLGNVALHFEKVFPSPDCSIRPSSHHHRIARAIDRDYRDKIHIRRDAAFDEARFVFRGSVKDTVFQKQAGDRAFHHRNGLLNAYYGSLMDFDNGDEVLQVGYVSTLTAMKYAYRRKRMHRLAAAQPRRAA